MGIMQVKKEHDGSIIARRFLGYVILLIFM